MIIVIPGAYNAQIGALGNVQGQTVTIGSILKVTERDRRPYPTDPGVPSEIWIDNTAAIGYICKEVRSTGTVWDRLDLLGDYIAFGDGDPGSNNDITRGYRPGSLRYARNTQTLWICDDNTQGAAIWSVLAAGALTLQTNGLPNGDQTLLNIVAGANMTITDDGFGNITFDSTGGGGTYTVNNGLTESPANNFQLGGATLGTGNLVRDTYITNDGYVLRIDQTNASTYALDLRHSGTGLNTGVGLRSQAGGIAVRANSSESWAFEGVSALDYTAALLRNASSTNDVVGLIKLVRDTSGTPFNGIGGSIDFWIETRQTIPAPLPTVPTVSLAGIWEVPGPAVLSRLSRFDIYGYSAGASLLNASVRGDGKFYLHQYGQTPANFPGTPVWGLGVDLNGNVIEYSPGTGGGDMLKSVYDVDNDGVVDSAERVEIIVRNSTGSTLTKGQIVYLSGATGNRPNALLSDASTEATSSKTIGMVVADIANNSDGYVAVNGTLHDLNTNSFADGDTLWLDTTPGGMVANTPPAEPNHAVFIGYVARAHPTLGRVVLKIQNGYELNELHGVLISSEANNDLLVYETSSTLWKNKSLSTAYPNIVTGSFGVTVDGVTTVVQVGQVGYVVMPYDGTITRWTITSNASGSISFDIWKNASIDTIPTIADSQVGGVYPSITGTNFGTSTNLTSWISTTFSAGHIFGFYVNSASTIKNATLTLRVTKS